MTLFKVKNSFRLNIIDKTYYLRQITTLGVCCNVTVSVAYRKHDNMRVQYTSYVLLALYNLYQ